MSDDPWKHRSEGMLCKSCMWFVVKEMIQEKDKPESIEARVGRCRKHAPSMEGYPVVFAHDWCGDHKLNENAGKKTIPFTTPQNMQRTAEHATGQHFDSKPAKA